jgi:hypothetical protein
VSDESAAPLPPQPADMSFLVTASELKDRKTKRRLRSVNRSEAIGPLVKIGNP